MWKGTIKRGHSKKFREINYLVTSLVKYVLVHFSVKKSRSPRTVLFHTVFELGRIEKFRIFYCCAPLMKKFREINLVL